MLTMDKHTKIAINPLNTGVGLYSAIISEELWVGVCKDFIEKHGSEAFLRAMLQAMRDQTDPTGAPHPMF